MFTFILYLHFLRDAEQMTNKLNIEFGENEQFQEITEYNIGIRKGPPLFLNFNPLLHNVEKWPNIL